MTCFRFQDAIRRFGEGFSSSLSLLSSGRDLGVSGVVGVGDRIEDEVELEIEIGVDSAEVKTGAGVEIEIALVKTGTGVVIAGVTGVGDGT